MQSPCSIHRTNWLHILRTGSGLLKSMSQLLQPSSQVQISSSSSSGKILPLQNRLTQVYYGNINCFTQFQASAMWWRMLLTRMTMFGVRLLCIEGRIKLPKLALQFNTRQLNLESKVVLLQVYLLQISSRVENKFSNVSISLSCGSMNTGFIVKFTRV